jgi:hypothetical protein
MRRGRAQRLIFRLGRFVISRSDGIETIHLQFIGPVDQLTVKINVPFHLGKAFDVILLCSHGFIFLSFL